MIPMVIQKLGILLIWLKPECSENPDGPSEKSEHAFILKNAWFYKYRDGYT